MRYSHQNKSVVSPLDGAILFVMWLTSSGDVIFNYNIGVSIRLTSLLSVFFFLTKLFAWRKRASPRATIYLVAWSLINALFSYNNAYPPRAIAYAVWLFSFVAFIWAFCIWIQTSEKIETLSRIYIYSGILVAIFGLSVLLLEKFGFAVPTISQPGRINGFSYEPSYFATYLIPFWVILAYVRERGLVATSSQRADSVWFGFLTLALILSTARTGFVALGFWYARLFLVSCLNVWLSNWRARSITAFAQYSLVGVVAVVVLIKTGSGDLYSLVEGTGLFDTAAHSTEQRIEGMQATLDVFRSSPIIAVGIGGVAPEIAAMSGLTTTSMAEARTSEGVSVFLEALAGTGVLGFLLLIVFFLLVLKDAWNVGVSEQQKFLARAYAWALIVQLAVLQLNQNILRSYFWYHVAFVAAFGGIGYRRLLPKMSLSSIRLPRRGGSP